MRTDTRIFSKEIKVILLGWHHPGEGGASAQNPNLPMTDRQEVLIGQKLWIIMSKGFKTVGLLMGPCLCKQLIFIFHLSTALLASSSLVSEILWWGGHSTLWSENHLKNTCQ